MAADVRIDIAAQFVGKKAFTQADVATAKLTKGVKNLAGAIGIAFGARGIGRAIKAFAEDDKAAQALGKTLQNLGLAYGSSAATVNGYISRLEQQTGVLDDELRPAMDRFLRATLSVTKSQELLNLALDISAGTGKSLTQVSQSLQKAYLGQTQALGRLGVGLSKAELTSASFEEIQQRLAVLFAGQASTAANTYAGEIAKLQVAVNNAKETIGKGFVDALKTASGSSTIDPVIKGIDKIANAFAYLTRETGKFIAITREAFDFSKGLQLFAPKGGYGNTNKGMGNISMSVSSQDTQKADRAAEAKAAAAQLKTSQALTKSTKESLKLAKARATFDLQKIQIEAALKGKLSEEDKIRLKLMKAIEEENLTNVEKYQKALEVAQTKTKELTDLLATIKTLEIKDPFGTWSVDPLTAAINALTVSIGGVGTQIRASGSEWSSFANSVATTVIRPNLTEWSSSFSAAAASAASATAAANAALTATTSAASKAAADAAAASAAAISAANKASADAVAKAQAEALTTLGKLNAETAASTAAATKAAQDAIDAANKTAAETVAAILAKASATAAAKAAEAAAGNQSTLEAFRSAEAAAATATGNNATKIEVTVTGDPFTDPNAVAEKVVAIIREAGNRGTVDVFGID
jgi:trimeric autotransporter adhesin